MKPGHTKTPKPQPPPPPPPAAPVGELVNGVMRYAGLRGRRILGPTTPLSLDDCHDVTIELPQITGGPHNIEATGCSDVKVIGGTLTQPTGTKSDPSDPEGHNALFDDCDDCSIEGTHCTGNQARGDGISLFNSRGCSARRCKISGPFAKKAKAAIIDGPSSQGCVLAELDVQTPKGQGGFGVNGGEGHVVRDTNWRGPGEITGEYYPGARVGEVELTNVTGPELYVDPETAAEPKQSGCRFGKRRKEKGK